MRVMSLRIAFATAAAVAAVAAPTASAEVKGPDLPEINCGIVSCTYQLERAIDNATAATDGVKECVAGAGRAVGYILQGTPQPQECSL
jgi:hypothetical protein